jgi:preprotein translocase subunit SecA
MAVFSRLLRAGDGRRLRALQGLVPDINAREPEIQRLSDEALRAKTAEFRQLLDNGEELDELLIDAFAVVREAATRVIGQRHYDVQLVGGSALHFGWVAEMKTGEGKTLVSTLPTYLNGLTGKGVHVITVNDYLARRDFEWMGSIHRWLGLEMGLIIPGNDDAETKRKHYAADITHGTNNEFGFDYLRDNMAVRSDDKVQRPHNFAIVDEVDSILVDEARTPLIISGKLTEAAALYTQFAKIAAGLKRDRDYEVDEEKRTVSTLDDGIEKVEEALGLENLYDAVSSNLVHQLLAALRAKELYRRDKDYVIADGEVKIVDEFTGRILDGRRWSEGLHQAVEAKEGVRIKEESQTLATITIQNYFRLYDKLAGMTGTAQTEAAELHATYGLDVVQVPTHRPLARLDQGDLIYKTEMGKFDAVVDDIIERQETGQPVLVGTVSVENSELLSGLLNKRGVKHNVLNAKQHTSEANIITQAGQLGSVTVATNMAGRGVDIVLGGNAEGLAERSLHAEAFDDYESEEAQARYEVLLKEHLERCTADGDTVRELGGLYVLGTERHESRRIDNQLRGRSGRQGDPGESRFYLSLEDELMRLFATGAMNWVMGKALPDDVPIEAKMVTKAIEKAQTTVETRNAEIRKNVLKYDEVMNEQRKVIYRHRDQILQGEDLRTDTIEHLQSAVDHLVGTFCEGDFAEEWDIPGLVAERNAFWPSEMDEEGVRATDTQAGLLEALNAEALAHYESREEEFGEKIYRSVERQVMLRIIDNRWRGHLFEMDYLKEGIGLRAMGQKDPLTEYQREGFEMFGQLMEAISRDYVRHIMHVQVRVEPPPEAAQPQTPLTYSAPESPSSAALVGGNGAGASPQSGAAPQPATPASPGAPQRPVHKTAEQKVGRNEPCHCGSGKKFKHCHGKK